MCGIVGIAGTKEAAPLILEALKRLEYRGYDSAGVATLEDGRLARRRAEGKLRNLEGRLATAPLHGAIGIGHTRWATHGEPSDENAHPHLNSDQTVAVVHNGIIENFSELKAYAAQTQPVDFTTMLSSERFSSNFTSGFTVPAPGALALVLSSLLFAQAHRSPYSFTAAFFGGMLLGPIYMKAGIESAVAAHFAADFLFFYASYLS